MPNHVINEVTLHGIPLDLAAPKILNKDGDIDFTVLVPLPLYFWPGSVSILHEKAFPGTHLDAARDIWGTKWNAYGLDEGGKYQSVLEKDGCTVLTFQTAWAAPRGWIVALFNTFECDITSKWLSEGGWAAHVEKYDHAALAELGGEAWKDTTLEDGSPEQKHLHKLLWGVEEFEDEEAC